MHTPDKKIHRVEVKREFCIGCGSCSASAPDAFEFDSASFLSKPKLGVENLADDYIMNVAKLCPVSAIYLYDKDGRQIYPEG